MHTCTRHAYKHTYIYTCMHTYIHTCMHTYMHTYIHTYMHAYMHTCIHAYIYTYIHAYMHTCIHTYMHTYIHAYMHTDSDLSSNWSLQAGSEEQGMENAPTESIFGWGQLQGLSQTVKGLKRKVQTLPISLHKKRK